MSFDEYKDWAIETYPGFMPSMQIVENKDKP